MPLLINWILDKTMGFARSFVQIMRASRPLSLIRERERARSLYISYRIIQDFGLVQKGSKNG